MWTDVEAKDRQSTMQGKEEYPSTSHLCSKTAVTVWGKLRGSSQLSCQVLAEERLDCTSRCSTLARVLDVLPMQAAMRSIPYR